MFSPSKILKQFRKYLNKFPIFTSFPFSLFLIGIEEFIEVNISCPCKYELNKFLTIFIFIGPPLFAFALMFIVLRPCLYKWCPCSPNKDSGSQQKTPNVNVNKDVQPNCWTSLGHCLIPPIMWIITALTDGDYVACACTKWEGTFAFDKELNRSWCQPTEQVDARNQSELRHEIQGYIGLSKALGYVLLAIFAVLIVLFVGICDSCASGKCSFCQSKIPDCCRCEDFDSYTRIQTQREQPDTDRNDVYAQIPLVRTISVHVNEASTEEQSL